VRGNARNVYSKGYYWEKKAAPRPKDRRAIFPRIDDKGKEKDLPKGKKGREKKSGQGKRGEKSFFQRGRGKIRQGCPQTSLSKKKKQT